MKFLRIFFAFFIAAFSALPVSADPAQELFKVLEMDKFLAQKAINYKEQLEIILENSELEASEREETQKKFNIVIDEVITFLGSKEVLKSFEQSYREVFTNSEIEYLVEFYSSPTGKKFLEQSGALNKNFMEKIAPEFNSIISRLQQIEEDKT